ncbi:MAG: RNA-binding S4 domain-containing protein [Amphiplicatus sp.]
MTLAVERSLSQRIDKWLWRARLFKTRSLAAKIVSSGSVRLTRGGTTRRVDKASFAVSAGDRLAFMSGPRLRLVEILACADRRGPAAEARLLYADHSPPSAPAFGAPALAQRDKGAGRPSKKDRRAIDELKKR